MLKQCEYTQIVYDYIDMVFRIALNYTKNPTDSEDISQTVFLKLFKTKRSFDSQEHIRNWLIRVTVNECKRWLGHHWRKNVSFEEYSETLFSATDEQKDVLRAVMALPEKYRLPIYLHYYEGYSTKEISEILRIPKGTVCTNLSRGRDILKIELMEGDSNA